MNRDELTRIIKITEQGVLIPCMVQPRASCNGIVGVYGDMLKIRITAPPVDGKANAALTKYLAKCCGLAGGMVRLHSGQSSRRKTVLLQTADHEAVIRTLLSAGG